MRSERSDGRRRKAETAVAGIRLAVPESVLDHDRFEYRWLNDTPARIHAKTKDDDWDIVTRDGVKEASPDLSNAFRYVVGTNKDGSPLYAYLCRKPRNYFDDDQRTKHRHLDRQLEDLRRGNDREGTTQSDYVPAGGISIV